jgi:hypothetical protein
MSNATSSSLRYAISSFCLVAGLGASVNAFATDTLIVNQAMKPNQHLTSANGKYRLVFQADTAQKNGRRLVLGSDGNLRLESHGKTPAWTSGTRGSRVNRLTVHDDGNVAMYDTANKQIWSTGTTQEVSTRASTAVVTYVGRGEKYATTGTTMTISRPSGTAAGDLMILAIQTATGVVPSDADPGTGGEWTRFARCQVDSNTDSSCNSASTDDDLGISLFYNYAGSSGAKTYTINKPDGKFTAAHLMVVRNTATSSPITNVQYFLDNGVDNTSTTGTNEEFRSTCPSFNALSRGMNVCALAHDDAQDFLNPNTTVWSRRSTTDIVRTDSALLVFSRAGSSSAQGATTFSYNGDAIDGTNKGNGVNVTYQIKPLP